MTGAIPVHCRGLCEVSSVGCESPVADSGVGDATNSQRSVGMSWVSCEWGAGHNLLPIVEGWLWALKPWVSLAFFL